MEIWVKSQILWNYCVTLTSVSSFVFTESLYISLIIHEAVYTFLQNYSRTHATLLLLIRATSHLTSTFPSVQVFSHARTADSNFQSLNPTATPTCVLGRFYSSPRLL